MKISDLINICHGRLYKEVNFDDLECINFTTDSRKVSFGDVYIGIKGNTFNGNDFYKEAFDKGALVCILDEGTSIVDGNGIIILVNDTIKALQDIAKYKRSLYDIPVIAITGSVGKTSVKDMVYGVVSSKYKTLCTKGNMNNHIGLPLTILGLEDHEALIVEVGMNHMGELHVLSEIARPTMALITNIGTAHIGNLGSRENILKAKLEVLDGMSGGELIINNDNDMLRTVVYDNLVTIGIDNDSDYMAVDIVDKPYSEEFLINGKKVEIPIGSKAFIYNALFAYVVGLKLGINEEDIINALKNIKLTPHRLEVIKQDNYTIIDDTYNASLDSVNNALGILSKVRSRRVFIFGDMLELDKYGEDIHKEIGKSVITNRVDLLITVGDLTKYTDKVAQNGGVRVIHFDSNQELLSEIDSLINQGDTVLVKASLGMNFLEIVEYLKGK